MKTKAKTKTKMKIKTKINTKAKPKTEMKTKIKAKTKMNKANQKSLKWPRTALFSFKNFARGLAVPWMVNSLLIDLEVP